MSPKYGVAVDVRDRDVLLADVHEWHGNTQVVGAAGEFERVSAVLYYRADMWRCLPAAGEVDRPHGPASSLAGVWPSHW